ncbi:Craniofacial development protein 2 [Glycine soja]|uniref:Craniofacial development protein 2 n=1 Tax=Glycine soja TaxID=3848 RepID=A0A445HNS4_GLYSO|nr:Craniofacial development protein 2 [Glycine soja]
MDAIRSGNWGFWQWNPLPQSRRRHIRSKSGSADATGGGGYRFLAKQAVTAASLTLTGDTIPQLSNHWRKAKEELDWLRARRMTSYGFLLYGPGSYAWYQCLDHFLPKPTVQNLMLKVVARKQRAVWLEYSVKRVWVKKLVHDRRIRFGTWNIGTLTGKSMEIVDVMVRRKINFMCLQETKWTGQKAKELDNSGFKLWYTGKIRLRNGVGIIVDKEWKKDVVDVRRVGDHIIALKVVVGQDTFNVISGYAPQVGLAEHFKVKFWEDLEGVLQDIPQGEKVFLGGDLNGHVGSVTRGFEGVHGGFGLGEMNGEGKSILEFSEALDLSIANTWFKKRAEHLITYKSGGTCSQIDFFLIRKSDRKYCLNCKVIPGESLTTQHRVLVMDVRIRDRAKRRSPMVAPMIKWWHLKGEKQGIFQQKIWVEGVFPQLI